MTPFRLTATALAVVLLPVVGPAPKAQAAAAAYGQEPWAYPPSGYSDFQRRAYADGIEGAKRDYGNHRNPDVNNRDEYRNPDVPPDERDNYRAAFRRGY